MSFVSSRKQSLIRAFSVTATLVFSAASSTVTQAYDGFGGYFSYIVSPQICKAQHTSQERYLIRSGFAQVRNSRNKSLKIVCPLHRTHYADRDGACDTSFDLRVRIRLQPARSRASARVRLSFADDEQGTTPAAFKKDQVISVANSKWDGSSTYTDAQHAEVSLDCVQKDSTGVDVNLDEERWVPSATITLPAGAMLRRLQFIGGQNAT